MQGDLWNTLVEFPFKLDFPPHCLNGLSTGIHWGEGVPSSIGGYANFWNDFRGIGPM